MSKLPEIQFYHHWRVVDPDDNIQAEAKVERRHGVLMIFNVWVAPELRGLGLGNAILQDIVTRFGHEDLFLTAEAFGDRPRSDSELLTWYKKFGFEPTDYPGGLVRRAQKRGEV